MAGVRDANFTLPDDGLTVVVLTNLGSAKPQRIADAVAGIYLANKPDEVLSKLGSYGGSTRTDPCHPRG